MLYLSMKQIFKIVLNLLLVLSAIFAHSQACDPSTPTFTMDLSGNPDSVWISPNTIREGLCCGLDPNASPPIRCVEFFFTLDTGAQGIKFDLASGAIPPGSLGYQINCGPYYQVGENICLNGPGPHRLTFCKPGSNKNRYSITSIPKPSVSSPQIVSDGCRGTLFANGYILSTITWRSVENNPVYNSYLSCSAGCSTTTVTMQPGAPPFVDYVVTGSPLGGCDNMVISRTTRIYFVNDKRAEILPKNPVICFGGTNATITANGIGGAPPYKYLWNTGATTQSISVGVGKYWVQISDTTSCPVATDTVIVGAYLSPIVANAGPDISSCANNPAAQLGGTVQMATGGIWSGGQGNYSASSATLNATYTPTPAEIAAGKVTHFLTTTGNGPCPAKKDSTILTITPAPSINAGADQTICANNATAQLNGTVTIAGGGTWTGGTGTFSPDRNTLKALYTPSAAEITAGSVILTLTSTGNGQCLPVSDQVIINISPAPTVNAGPDITVCANNPSLQLNGGVTIATGGTWTGGTGTFSSRNILTPSYIPSAAEINAGSVTLTLTTTGIGNCRPLSDNVNITITPAPVINAGPDLSTCGNNPSAQLSGSVTIATGLVWSGGNGNFSPADNILNPVYTPSASEITAGSVTLTATSTGNGRCLAVSDQVVLRITPAPTINAGNDIAICANNATASLSGTVTVATGGTWSGGSGTFSSSNNLNTNYIPSAAEIAAKSVILTFTSTGNGTCLPVSDQVMVTITDAPVINAGPDISVCANNAGIKLNGTVTIAGGGVWTGGSGIFTPDRNSLTADYAPAGSETIPGSFILTLTSTSNGNCLPVSDDVRITVTPAPVINAGEDQTVCANNSAVQLAATVSTASGGTWTGGTGTFSPGRNSLAAVYNPSAAEIAAGQVNLTITSAGNGSCLPVSDQMKITITPAPQVNAGTDITVCANNPEADLSGTITIASGGFWTGGQGSFSPDRNSLNARYTPAPSELNNSSVTLRLNSAGNGNCLAVTDSVVINFTPRPFADAGPDQAVCANNAAVSLSGTVTVAGGGLWTSSGSGTFNPGPQNLTTTYIPSADEITAGKAILKLTTTGNGKCIEVSDFMVITVSPAPVINAGPDLTVCANISATALAGKVTVAAGGRWTGGTGTYNPSQDSLVTVYSPSQAEITSGAAKLVLTSTGNGKCLAVSDTMNISITPAPVADAGPDNDVCANNSEIKLAGKVTIASGGIWSGTAQNFSPANNFLNTKYTPSAAETEAGFIQFVLTTTGNGTCLPARDTVRINITPAPVADAGQDFSICGNSPDVNLNGKVSVASGGIWSGGNGTYSGNSSLNSTYTVTPQEIEIGTILLTLTTTGNGKCLPVSDQVLITVKNPDPEAIAGPDQILCGTADSVNLNGIIKAAAGGIWTTNGTGQFNTPSDVLNTYFLPSTADKASGTVKFILTSTGNEPCPAVSDTMVVTFTGLPSVDAGSDKTACMNSVPVLQFNATGSPARWTGGSGVYMPNDSTLNASYTPDPAEVGQTIKFYLTTIANSACPEVKDSVVITFEPGPKISAVNDFTVCADSSVFSVSAIPQVATKVLWITSGTGTVTTPDQNITGYIPSAYDTLAGKVRFVVTTTDNGACPAARDEVEVTIIPVPVISAGNDITVCGDTAIVPVNGRIYNASAVHWTTSGNGNFSSDSTVSLYKVTPEDTAAHIVNLIIESTDHGMCRPVRDTMALLITPRPVVIAGTPQTVCADREFITMDGMIFNAAGGVWWSEGTGVFSPSSADPASYYITAADTSAGQVQLFLVSAGNGLCKPVTDSVTILFTPVPVADAGEDIFICADQSVISLSGKIFNASSALWTTTGSGFFTPDNTSLTTVYNIVPSDTTESLITFSLQAGGTGSCGAVTDYRNIILSPAPIVDAGTDQPLCITQDSVFLKGSVSVATGIDWSTSGTGTFRPGLTSTSMIYLPSAADKSSGKVTIYAESTENGLCNSVKDSMTITFIPMPVADAGSDLTICADSSGIKLSGSITNTNDLNWQTTGTGYFSDAGNISPVYYPSAADTIAGRIKIVLTGEANTHCPAVKDTVSISITPKPIIDAGENITVCANNAAATLNGKVFIAKGIEWSNGNGMFSNVNILNSSYIPSAAEIASGKAKLIITSTQNGDCRAVKDSMEIIITPAPVANAGTTKTVCANNAQIVLNGKVTRAGNGIWSGGTGTFSPGRNALTTVYNPSTSEKNAGSVSLILTTTDNGLCLAVSDTVDLIITPAPVVDIKPVTPVCANNPSAQISGSVTVAQGGRWSGGQGSFQPGNTSLNITYIPSKEEITAGSVTLVLTSTGNGRCLAVSDSVTFPVTPSPVITTIPDFTVCADTAIIKINAEVRIAGGGNWTSSGSGNFTSNGLSASYIPSDKDTADHKVTFIVSSTGNGNCLPVTDTLEVAITPAPTVFAGPDSEVCKTETSVKLNGQTMTAAGGLWTTTGTGGLFNADNSTDASYTISDNDKNQVNIPFVLTTTGNGMCKAKKDTMLLIFHEIPTVNAGPAMICADSTGAPLKAVFANATGVKWSGAGTGIFTPSAQGDAVVYKPSSADIKKGSVVISVQTTGNGVCTAVADELMLTITPMPQAFAGKDVTVCADTAFINISGSAGNATSINWMASGGGSFSETVLTTRYQPSAVDVLQGKAEIILQVNGHPLCTPALDTMVITITPAPAINSGADTTICPTADKIHLISSFTVAGGAAWSTSGTGSFSPNAASTVYSVSQEDKNRGEIILTAVSTGNGMCKAVSDTRKLFIKPEPFASAGPHQIICKDAEAVAFSGTVRVATGARWTSSGNGIFTPSDTTMLTYYRPTQEDKQKDVINIYFTSTGNSTCRAVTDSITLRFVEPPAANAGPDRTVCIQAASIDLSGTVQNATGGTWTGGHGIFRPDNNQLVINYTPVNRDTTERIVKLALTTTGNEGCFAQDSLNIFFYPAPYTSFHQVPVCTGDPGFITTLPSQGNYTPDGGFKWTLNGKVLNENSPQLEIKTPGVYTVHYKVGECTVNDTTSALFYPKPVAENQSSVIFCREEDVSAVLDAGPGQSYIWEKTKDTTRKIRTGEPGYYTVRIYNEFNCFIKDSVYLKDACPPKLFPHNAFSPNHDDLNEFFIVHGGYLKNFSITIFNRWGEIIFYSTDPKDGWDGNYRNEPMPPGVYPYIINYEAEHEEFSEGRKKYSGSVTLIR
jgi:gliding motility-associated-like protein